MNNFTLEELETLRNGLSWLVDARAFHKLTPILKLNDKLGTMINNERAKLTEQVKS